MNEQAKVLVVYDVPDNAKLLIYNLKDEGYRVLEACSSAGALGLVETQAPDILLLDVMMPDQSGLEVLQTLKASETAASIPVILVAADALDEQIAQGLDLGAYDYVVKPFSYTVLAARIRAALREREHQEKLEQLAATDPLTQLFNRRQFSQMVEREIQRVHRNGGPLCLLMLDIDCFKQINDTYGHGVGDDVIVKLANVLREQLRTVDIIGRFGGDECVICLPDTALDQAVQVAERICTAIAGLQVKSHGRLIPFTVSIGVSSLGSDAGFKDLYVAADRALYQAKHSGRNQVCLSNLDKFHQ